MLVKTSEDGTRGPGHRAVSRCFGSKALRKEDSPQLGGGCAANRLGSGGRTQPGGFQNRHRSGLL